MNRGDTYYISLDYTVNGVPLEEAELDEIEFYYGTNRFLLSKGEIAIDPETGKYVVFIEQEPSFDLEDKTQYQIRVKKGNIVSSPKIDKTKIVEAISREVI